MFTLNQVYLRLSVIQSEAAKNLMKTNSRNQHDACVFHQTAGRKRQIIKRSWRTFQKYILDSCCCPLWPMVKLFRKFSQRHLFRRSCCEMPEEQFEVTSVKLDRAAMEKTLDSWSGDRSKRSGKVIGSGWNVSWVYLSLGSAATWTWPTEKAEKSVK